VVVMIHFVHGDVVFLPDSVQQTRKMKSLGGSQGLDL